MAPEKKERAPRPKADKTKQFDVTITVVHDNRKGVSKSVQKAQRFSFETEIEAVVFANQFSKEDR